MSNQGLRDDLRDVAAGLLTPFDEANPDEILYDELAATAKWLHEEGLNLFLACANISEYHSLINEERVELVRVSRRALPPDGTVLAGVGGSVHNAMFLAQAHETNGADGIMVMPPDHTFKHERGVLQYYHRVADAVDIGVVPYLRGFEVTVPLVERIAAHENIIGMKWAIPNIELFAECVSNVDENDVIWMCGMAEPPTPAYWQEGAEGFSAGVTNFEPRLGLAMFDALSAGNYDRARRLRDLTIPFMNFRGECGQDNTYASANSVPAVKLGLELAGQTAGTVRDPLVELSNTDQERGQEYYTDLQDEINDIL